jgi:hypothetical protein
VAERLARAAAGARAHAEAMFLFGPPTAENALAFVTWQDRRMRELAGAGAWVVSLHGQAVTTIGNVEPASHDEAVMLMDALHGRGWSARGFELHRMGGL